MISESPDQKNDTKTENVENKHRFVQINSTPPGVIRQVFRHKFKDREGRRSQRIFNSAGKYLVIVDMYLNKVPGVNNEIEVILYLADPKTIDIRELSEAKKDQKESPKE